MATTKQVLRPKEVAEMLGLTRNTIYLMCKSGKLPYTKYEGIRGVFFHADAIQAYLNSMLVPVSNANEKATEYILNN